MSKATLKAITEEFEETSESQKDVLDRLPKETQGVEKYLTEDATGPAYIAYFFQVLKCCRQLAKPLV